MSLSVAGRVVHTTCATDIARQTAGNWRRPEALRRVLPSVMVIMSCAKSDIGPPVPVGMSPEEFARGYLPPQASSECGTFASMVQGRAGPKAHADDIVCSARFSDTTYVVVVRGRKGLLLVHRDWTVPAPFISTTEQMLLNETTSRLGAGEPCRTRRRARRWELADSAVLTFQVVLPDVSSEPAYFLWERFPPRHRC